VTNEHTFKCIWVMKLRKDKRTVSGVGCELHLFVLSGSCRLTFFSSVTYSGASNLSEKARNFGSLHLKRQRHFSLFLLFLVSLYSVCVCARARTRVYPEVSGLSR
jgi:hypothetical protein